MSTETTIYNFAASALLLNREIINADTDKTNEVRAFNTHWQIALESTLQDLDLDMLSTPITLELITSLTEGPWTYVYKYPSNCLLMRRIVSGTIVDRRSTHIAKKTAMYGSLKAIYTNEADAVLECIPKDISLSALNSSAIMAVAYKLAYLAAPLITGKGAKTLKKEIMEQYLVFKTEAQETDARENFNYEDDYARSEFVEARLS